MIAKTRYRLVTATMALFQDHDHHVSRMVPADTIITVMDGKPFNGERLLDIELDGAVVMMFTQDLRARTEVLKD